jgi:hypothetical protein
MTEGNSSAHPHKFFEFDHTTGGYTEQYTIGLTKREYFAATAAQGLATMPELDNSLVAKHAVLIADALIEELNKQSK